MSKVNKKIIIAVAVAAAFILAGGITAFLLLKDNGTAAVVNGVKILNEKIEEEISKVATRYEAQGETLLPEQYIEMRESIVENMITREVLLQEAALYEVDNGEIENQIAAFKENFPDEESFISALSTQGFDLDGFKKTISEDLKIQKLIEEKVPTEIVIPEDEMITFYDENPSYFTQPERIHASHILVSLQDKTTDEEKEAALEKINRIQEELKNGADFVKLAKNESEGPSAPKGGDLGEFSRGQMVSTFEEVAFALPEGKISGIVETQFGYHIIKTHERFPETSHPFEDVKESISSYLKQEKSQTIMVDFINALKDAANIRIIKFKAPKVSAE